MILEDCTSYVSPATREHSRRANIQEHMKVSHLFMEPCKRQMSATEARGLRISVYFRCNVYKTLWT